MSATYLHTHSLHGLSYAFRILHTLFRILPAAIFICIAAYTASAENTVERFIWNQANTRMMHAASPKDYLQAAQGYRRLLRKDICNPALLNNLGCALTMGGDYENALKAFRHAEQYSGTTPETAQGISAAVCRRDKLPVTQLPWHRTAFFWHYRLSTRMRIMTALAGWAVMWLGFLFYLLRKKNKKRELNIFLNFSETLIATGALMFLLSGTSSCFSLFQEKQDMSYWQNAEFSAPEIEEAL
ncbi:MAG: hypothetical protein R6V06_07835 [Kiritimatiellia bacterium]